MFRVHRHDRKPDEYNPTETSQRFRPIYDPAGTPIPTLYGAESLEGALAETILRGVPLDGPDRRVFADRLTPYAYSRLQPTRSLRLAILHDPHVKRLRVSAAALAESPPDAYPWTAT